MATFHEGDKVVVVKGDGPKDKAVGKTGTVVELHPAGLIFVKGPGGLLDRLGMPRGYSPDQLQHAA